MHIDVDNDGIADFFGNMTIADGPMHAGQIYSVYDDTVTVPE